jgi:hypothetical protein
MIDELNIFNYHEIKTLSASQIKGFIADKVLNFGVDAVEIYQSLSLQEKVLDLIKKDKTLKLSIENQFMKFVGSKSSEIPTKINGRNCKVYDKITKYDFKAINDKGYNVICEEIERLTEEKKALEEEFKEKKIAPFERCTVIEISGSIAK